MKKSREQKKRLYLNTSASQKLTLISSIGVLIVLALMIISFGTKTTLAGGSDYITNEFLLYEDSIASNFAASDSSNDCAVGYILNLEDGTTICETTASGLPIVNSSNNSSNYTKTK